ncbi:hypothetical protein [Thermomonas sp.]|nr:hypothetical protein [Thermomonas sp.]MDI1253003.1 hypothetical protein [Thermomonas sp.]
MSNPMIGYFAIAVFGLMMIGVILTGIEFRKMRGNDDAKSPEEKSNR